LRIDRVRQGGGAGQVQVSDCDLGAMAREHPGARRAQALRAAGDQCLFAGDTP